MKPISLHPDNGRYFLFRGKPTVLISSAEHYGAVLNLDFDFRPYLAELHAHGLNQTRVFSGAYREVPGSFGIQSNTLAPQPARFCAPWPRVGPEMAADGLPKFDLAAWNPTYFKRLQDFCREAGRRGVVVELVLFCPFYEDAMWAVSPMNARNNVGGIGAVAARTDVYALKDQRLQAVQEALTRRLVEATREFDNVYYEICNEPYFGGVTPEWQARIAATIVESEKALPHKHLIAQNIANGSAKVTNPNPHVSIFNFHYASPPDAVGDNYALGKVIAFDETGFKGTADSVYRTDAWEFLLAGGAVYSHLDYSFTVEHEKGTYAFGPSTPGGGGAALRRQLGALKRFMDRLPLVSLRPDNGLVAGAPSGSARALRGDNAIALYLKSGTAAATSLTLTAVPAARWRAAWINPITGHIEEERDIDHRRSGGGPLTIAAVPGSSGEAALRLLRKR